MKWGGSAQPNPADPIRPGSMALFAHDLKTPINHIMGFSQLLLEEAEDGGLSQYLPVLQQIHAAGQELLAFVNDNLTGEPGEGQGPSQIQLHRGLRPTLLSIVRYSARLQDESRNVGHTELLPDLQKICAAVKQVLEVVENCPPLFPPESGASPTAGRAAREAPVAPSSALSPGASGVPSDVGSGSLLVVDDNEPNQQLLTRHLERQGHTVSVAENGQRALEMIRTGSFDLVLLDVIMPGVDGYQVLEYLKGHDGLRDIPVIMLSALDDTDSIIKCLQLGAEDYLSKPINPVLLRARINASLERWRPDLAHRQQLQEQFQQAQEMESAGRHPGGVTHAFNNMLSVILQAAQRSVTLVRQLMVFSRRR